ncbi:hypothetical protein LSAT2_016385 [Lamellibrachia satsuma]|nr:hypothetical protein LSAT2_016385 [Lamellibrachia satsuma]
MIITTVARVFVLLMAAVTSLSTAAFGSPVRHSPLRITDARHVSVDSVRVKWEASTGDEGRSDTVVVALGLDGCHNASRVVQLGRSLQATVTAVTNGPLRGAKELDPLRDD